MAKQKKEGSVFEIIVVLAIVAIVAVTGQVLINYEQKGVYNQVSSTGSSDSITGFVVSEPTGEAEVTENPFTDIGVKDIEVNPPSPLIGQSFEVRIILKNEGKSAIKTPFYVQAELTPSGENIKPTIVNSAVGTVLEPGDETSAVFQITMVATEGPVKIIAIADSTAKLDDYNPGNNQRSKTIIITAE